MAMTVKMHPTTNSGLTSSALRCLEPSLSKTCIDHLAAEFEELEGVGVVERGHGLIAFIRSNCAAKSFMLER